MKRMIVTLCALGLAFQAASGWALESEVRMHAGQPALYVNGILASQILAAPYGMAIPDIKVAYDGGVRIINCYYRFSWTGPEEYDWSRADATLDRALAAYPDLMFIPRMLLSPGAWFAQQYPDEISMRDDGTVAGMFGGGRNAGANGHPSFSSSHYSELSKKAVTTVIRHIEEKYGDRIVGYQVGNGFGGEWLPFNSFWENPPHPAKFGVEDYSVAARDDFRRWLRDNYKADVAALRKAWADPAVTFENAAIPNEIERYSTTHGIFFDPAVGRRVPDWFWFYNDSVAQVLLDNAAWVKEVTQRKKIVGAFFGYFWCNFPNLSQVHAGHLGLARVLNSNDVDFLCSPYTYDNKYVGGPNNSQSFPEAAQLHGKLYLNENDTETWLTQRQWRWGNSLNNPTTWEETKGLLIRDFAYSFTKGFGLWWTDLRGGTFQDPQIVKLFADLHKIDEDNLDKDKSSTAEICAVLDGKSFTYTGDGEPIFNALLTAQKQWQFGFIGAPWEPHLLDDIANPALKDFKLYIFLNTFRITPEQRAAVHAKLKRNGATALWIFAPGYIQDDKHSIESMSALTGITMAEDFTTSGELHVDISNTQHPITRGLPARFAYGTDVDVESIIRFYDHRIYLKDPRDPPLYRDLPGFRVKPRFFAHDPQATVLGMLAGVNEPGLVIKPQQGWTSIYSSAPIVPSALIRNIARGAGIHIYSDADDVVYSNRDFVCIYAPNGGTRTVRLPERAKVVDALENKTVADNVTEFPLDLNKNTSVLLRLER